jgi:ureidoacrylate peracid hydrolase
MHVTADDTALLVIDMQNGFCRPKGSMATLGLDTSMCEAVIPQVRSLVDAAHDADVPVIYTRYVYLPGYADGGLLPTEILPAMRDINALAEGSWDAAIVDELAPTGSDLVVDKSRYSAFYGTRLEPILTGLGVRSLVICGVTTNMCVEGTARDASQRDYPTFVVGDACAETDAQRHLNALQTLSFGFCWVTDVDAVRAAWTSVRLPNGAART